mmetsp:Transcript_57946/g.95695  ORF Transcript_57946/g.95695 Transcript_57946/m.95695 type:complete len:206 (+) Transcript_57946:131-748(+)|eukprot:CAMPEP_0119332504 /NCGR_PEP_ID=MMETSP1333-20130426/82919_1 /TAXON_ID=418940 /ORGANISM="Scyphosphaera apsteinii, Strain RCC1455" /LENGTH=205 /DNA_ID=CAMNT_0007342351 /DNA_START=95 /DNA_END=712 /DNA_ORIENTATION=+
MATQIVKGEPVPAFAVGNQPRTFNSGFFSCANCPSLPCVVTWCLPSITLGHLYEKLFQTKYSCVFIAVGLGALNVYVYFTTQRFLDVVEDVNMGYSRLPPDQQELYLADDDFRAKYDQERERKLIAAEIWWMLVSFLYFTLACVLTCKLRGVVRKRHNISGSAATDCLASAFCPCCTQTQVLKQEGIADSYSLCSPTGTTGSALV